MADILTPPADELDEYGRFLHVLRVHRFPRLPVGSRFLELEHVDHHDRSCIGILPESVHFVQVGVKRSHPAPPTETRTKKGTVPPRR